MEPGSTLDCTVLLVDDEEANLDLLEGILELSGYRSLVRTSDAREVIGLFERHRPDLVLLDLHMPYHTGFELLSELGRRTEPGDYLPVLVLTADVTVEARERALSTGARDFLTKPFDGMEVVLRVRNLLEARILHRQQRDARRRAEVAEARAALLAEVSRVLAAALDGSTALARLPALIAPRWADGSVVLLAEGERMRPVAAAHRDPGREMALLATPLPSATLLAGLPPSERSRVLTTAGMQGVVSILVAPFRVEGEVAGALLLERCGEGAGWGAEERELFEEVAARTALAIENARLFARAERATRARDRMLAVVAHDLRNPLAVIGMYGEMALSMLPPDGDEYTRRGLTSIHETTGRIQHIVEDLMDVAAMDEGVFRVHPREQPLSPLVEEARRLLAPLAEAGGVDLRFTDAGCADPRVRVDGARLLQLLSNLVGNALKFTPRGGRVEVRWRPTAEGLEVAVVDSGPGIRPEQIPHVFGAFWQANDAERRGVGLGLWIARAIVEGHCGRIWVESPPGRGAAFHFTLPATGEQDPPRPRPALPAG